MGSCLRKVAGIAAVGAVAAPVAGCDLEQTGVGSTVATYVTLISYSDYTSACEMLSAEYRNQHSDGTDCAARLESAYAYLDHADRDAIVSAQYVSVDETRVVGEDDVFVPDGALRITVVETETEYRTVNGKRQRVTEVETEDAMAPDFTPGESGFTLVEETSGWRISGGVF